MSLSLLSLLKSYHNYQDLVNGRDKLPNWERLWFDLAKDEIKRNTRDGVTSIVVEEEDCALIGKGKKDKGMKAQGEVKSKQKHRKKKYLSKIKCFHWHEYGHYATKCLHRKSSKELAIVVGDTLASYLSWISP